MAVLPKHKKNNARHWLQFKTGEQYNGRDLYFISLTGIANFKNLRSYSTKYNQSNTFGMSFNVDAREPLENIPIPPRTGYRPKFLAKHWSVYTGLNEIFNDNKAVNNRHGVKAFGLKNANNIIKDLSIKFTATLGDSQYVRNQIGMTTIESNAYLYRVGYQVDVLVYWSGGYER